MLLILSKEKLCLHDYDTTIYHSNLLVAANKINSLHFFSEVQAVNEYDKYLWTLVHDLGMQLRTSAHCTGVQCIRQGKFDLDVALLRKHWQLDHIVDNMDRCRRILEEHQNLMKPESARLSM